MLEVCALHLIQSDCLGDSYLKGAGEANATGHCVQATNTDSCKVEEKSVAVRVLSLLPPLLHWAEMVVLKAVSFTLLTQNSVHT